jgi:hypothetical protein
MNGGALNIGTTLDVSRNNSREFYMNGGEFLGTDPEKKLHFWWGNSQISANAA